jgi:hypothetical protein
VSGERATVGKDPWCAALHFGLTLAGEPAYASAKAELTAASDKGVDDATVDGLARVAPIALR